MIGDAEWLGACMASESNEPHEWPYIGWVVRNRVEAPRRYPNKYADVVRQPWQFSYWNEYADIVRHEQAFVEASKGRIRHQLDRAEDCARWLLEIDGEHSPIPRDCFYFWSPVSMPERGNCPWWASKKDWPLEWFTVPGVDGFRFTFAREVA